MYKKIPNQNKAGSFTNVARVVETDEGEYHYIEENVNDIIARNDNMYQGWLCWAGLESLFIDADGTVYNASCKVDILGNIHTGFELPDFPVECLKKWCACAADINTSKVAEQKYIKFLRVGKNIS